jgi:hypothetical protein
MVTARRLRSAPAEFRAGTDRSSTRRIAGGLAHQGRRGQACGESRRSNADHGRRRAQGDHAGQAGGKRAPDTSPARSRTCRSAPSGQSFSQRVCVLRSKRRCRLQFSTGATGTGGVTSPGSDISGDFVTTGLSGLSSSRNLSSMPWIADLTSSGPRSLMSVCW